jgi:hypothetical protein
MEAITIQDQAVVQEIVKPFLIQTRIPMEKQEKLILEKTFIRFEE